MPDPTNRTELIMPKSTRDMTRGVMESIKSAIEVHYGCEPGDGLSRPIIQPGSFQDTGADFVIVWEEGPYEWVYDEMMRDIMADVCKSSGQFYGVRFRVETVNAWGCIALYVD